MIGAPIGIVGIGEPILIGAGPTPSGGSGGGAGRTRRQAKEWRVGDWRRGVYRYPAWAETRKRS